MKEWQQQQRAARLPNPVCDTVMNSTVPGMANTAHRSNTYPAQIGAAVMFNREQVTTSTASPGDAGGPYLCGPTTHCTDTVRHLHVPAQQPDMRNDLFVGIA